MSVKVPGLSTAKNDEQVYQFETARLIARAADELRAIADRIERSASVLVQGNIRPDISAFPNARLVRDAINEYRYRHTAHVLQHLDSALDSAMLADQARTVAAEGEPKP
jgi:hypothetical protein